MTGERRKTWQQEPRRREYILGATLDCIAIYGITGTTYRKISEASGIPLGSLTYYYPSMQVLLQEAFESLAHEVSEQFAVTLRQASNRDEACHAIVDIIFGQSISGEKTSQLSYELYSFSCRTPSMKLIMKAWMCKSRASLELYFSPLAAVALDALIEGLILHRSVIPVSREEVYSMVVKLADL